MRRSNRERTEATRQALIDAARILFVENGYAETATPDIVETAGVTRGALYHHFEDKKALFRAVVEQEADAVATAIEERSLGAGSAYDRLLAGAFAYFDAMVVAGRTRLLLLDGPAVLEVQAVDGEHAEASLREGLAEFLAETDGPDVLLSPLTTLLSAAFDRAALAIEAGGNRRDYEQAIASLIGGLGGDHLLR
ncbi:TetR family transcriptional regulator [Rhizobium rhizogenes]|uniref:TetR/AcrR family transcriptional regulator n=1 Tax=Rhizobium TaxID=379 RepID=UPI00026EE483|nr:MULTISPECIES: TetR/AcrR family transcriptional regulator [Rhizobium]EJK80587.1 transcriptional regulator [Rhizobium sp. AP16]NTF88505.1 TetR family transcriptional regulator [Rhizobium rhizogenes]